MSTTFGNFKKGIATQNICPARRKTTKPPLLVMIKNTLFSPTTPD
jgi:hypothetical protein